MRLGKFSYNLNHILFLRKIPISVQLSQRNALIVCHRHQTLSVISCFVTRTHRALRLDLSQQLIDDRDIFHSSRQIGQEVIALKLDDRGDNNNIEDHLDCQSK